MNKKQERYVIDRHRLSGALAKAGIHSYVEVGRKAGYSDKWLQNMIDKGSITKPMVMFLKQNGISYEEVKPLEEKEKPVARAPHERIADMEPDKFFRELYGTVYTAVRDALNGGAQ